MRKLSLLTGALLVLALAVAGGLSTPQAAHAVCYCPSGPYLETPNTWGKGTSCQAAHDQMVVNATNSAYAACGVASQTCLGNIVLTWGCQDLGGGMYQVDGVREYKCKECTDPIDPIDPRP